MLEVDNISVSYGRIPAVRGVSLTVDEGEIVTLVGPNGAGKTTLVNVLTGFQKPTHGRVVLAGVDVTGMPPHRIGRRGRHRPQPARGVAACPRHPGVDELHR